MFYSYDPEDQWILALTNTGSYNMTSFLATNCPDKQLCLELLRFSYVSLNGMVNKALTFEQVQSVFKKTTEEVNAVQTKKQGKISKN